MKPEIVSTALVIFKGERIGCLERLIYIRSRIQKRPKRGENRPLRVDT